MTGPHRSLAGRHAIVTGGGRGIGAAIAGVLAEHGAAVSLIGRNAEALLATAARIGQTSGARMATAAADVTDEAAVRAAIADLTARQGAPAILVNNAGIAVSAPFLKSDAAFWRKVLDVDLMGAVHCTRAVLPAMLAAGWGRVVNIASTAALKGYPYITAYCAAKHAMLGLTRALALETATKGVTVNAVCPGYTETDIVRDSLDNIVAKTGRSRDEALANLVSHNPQGRLIRPGEVADSVLWLCGESAASVTGQSIAVAGGEVM